MNDLDFLIDRCGRAAAHPPHKYGALVNGSIVHPLYCDGLPEGVDE